MWNLNFSTFVKSVCRMFSAIFNQNKRNWPALATTTALAALRMLLKVCSRLTCIDRIEEKNLTKKIAGFDKKSGSTNVLCATTTAKLSHTSTKCRLAWRRSGEESIVKRFSLKSTHSRHFMEILCRLSPQPIFLVSIFGFFPPTFIAFG